MSGRVPYKQPRRRVLARSSVNSCRIPTRDTRFWNQVPVRTTVLVSPLTINKNSAGGFGMPRIGGWCHHATPPRPSLLPCALARVLRVGAMRTHQGMIQEREPCPCLHAQQVTTCRDVATVAIVLPPPSLNPGDDGGNKLFNSRVEGVTGSAPGVAVCCRTGPVRPRPHPLEHIVEANVK